MKSMMETVRKDDRRETARGTRLLRGYLHKTSNSLCGIKGYASLIAREGAGDGDQAAWAAKMHASKVPDLGFVITYGAWRFT